MARRADDDDGGDEKPVRPLSKREEEFCLNIVAGMDAEDAYTSAGYASAGARGNASRLIASDIIKNRVAALRAPAVRQVFLTHREHLEKLAELRDAALCGKHPSFGAAVAAEIARGRCAGLYTEKVEHTGPDGGPLEIAVRQKAKDAEELFDRWQRLQLHTDS